MVGKQRNEEDDDAACEWDITWDWSEEAEPLRVGTIWSDRLAIVQGISYGPLVSTEGLLIRVP